MSSRHRLRTATAALPICLRHYRLGRIRLDALRRSWDIHATPTNGDTVVDVAMSTSLSNAIARDKARPAWNVMSVSSVFSLRRLLLLL
jgi:hypothetical protein